MNRLRLIWRKSLNGFMLTMTGVAALAVVSILFLILGYLIWNGWLGELGLLHQTSKAGG